MKLNRLLSYTFFVITLTLYWFDFTTLGEYYTMIGISLLILINGNEHIED